MQEDQQTGNILWPAADLGGTTIRLLLVAERAGRPEAVIRSKTTNPKGIPAIIEALRGLLYDGAAAAADRGMSVAPVLAIGAPGRIETTPGGRRFIAPRTAANLEAFPGELDRVNLATELAAGLGLEHGRVFWENDAVVQGRHLIHELLEDPAVESTLRDHEVVCINPGTGLGGCVASVGHDAVEVFTDGHISELLIHPLKVTGNLGAATVVVRSSGDGRNIGLELRAGDTVFEDEIESLECKQAEDFLSGEGLARIANGLERSCGRFEAAGSCFGVGDGAVDGKLVSGLIEAGGESLPVQAARLIGDVGGAALARLMTGLRDGMMVKSELFPDWALEDMERLKGVTRFILGGGVSSTPLGRHMAAVARAHLAHWPELHLFERDTLSDAGALGAFSLIPEATRRSIEGDLGGVVDFRPSGDR